MCSITSLYLQVRECARVLYIPQSIQSGSEWSCNSSLTELQIKGAVDSKLDRIHVFFLLRLQDIGRVALISSGGLPVSLSKLHQLHTLTRTHTHTNACLHTNTCGVWKQDRFNVQGPSIIHGIFNVNRLLQFVTISGWSLRWAAQFTSCPRFYLPAALSFPVALYITHSVTFIVCQVSKWPR